MLRSQTRRDRGPLATLLLALLLVLVPSLAGCGSGSGASVGTSTGAGAGAGASGPAAGAYAGLAPATATTDLPTVTVAQLPAEAVDTLRLIEQGGPFPYPKDGATFQNREGILPRQQSGFYQEYTVITPGSADRGARRIVTGADGSRFWSDDHYASFSEVVSGEAS